MEPIVSKPLPVSLNQQRSHGPIFFRYVCERWSHLRLPRLTNRNYMWAIIIFLAVPIKLGKCVTIKTHSMRLSSQPTQV